MTEKQIKLAKLVLTLGAEDSFVDVRQAAREERAVLDEVVDRDAVLFGLAGGGTSAGLCAVCGLVGWVVGARRFHRLSLVLLGQAVLLLLFLELGHVLLGHGAHGGELGADLVHFVALKRVLFADLLDFLVAEHAALLSILARLVGGRRFFTGLLGLSSLLLDLESSTSGTF